MHNHLVTARPINGGQQKFWTGAMIESWPVYLSDSDAAARMKREDARRYARAFTERLPGYRWTVEAQ